MRTQSGDTLYKSGTKTTTQYQKLLYIVITGLYIPSEMALSCVGVCSLQESVSQLGDTFARHYRLYLARIDSAGLMIELNIFIRNFAFTVSCIP